LFATVSKNQGSNFGVKASNFRVKASGFDVKASIFGVRRYDFCQGLQDQKERSGIADR
jgi:hypothetical protein